MRGYFPMMRAFIAWKKSFKSNIEKFDVFTVFISFWSEWIYEINASVFFQTGLNFEYKFPYREPKKKRKTKNEIVVYCKSQYWVNAGISCTRKACIWSHGESQTTNRQPNPVNSRRKNPNPKKARMPPYCYQSHSYRFQWISAVRLRVVFFRRLVGCLWLPGN